MLHLDVIAGTFDGRHAKYGEKAVTVKCMLTNNDLTLQTVGTLSNFDLQVMCHPFILRVDREFRPPYNLTSAKMTYSHL